MVWVTHRSNVSEGYGSGLMPVQDRFCIDRCCRSIGRYRCMHRLGGWPFVHPPNRIRAYFASVTSAPPCSSLECIREYPKYTARPITSHTANRSQVSHGSDQIR